MQNSLKKYKETYLLPSALTLGMLCIVYLFDGLFPFGQNTLAWGDMAQQALPFMVQFKDIAAGNQGLLYNLANASGMNFWGVFLYFICSPFTALGLLVPKSGFYAFANILVALKMMLACCSATAHFAGKYALFPVEKRQAGAIGVLYAFCGFTLLYYQNIVWLDQLILFPLLMTSLEVLYRKGRIAPFAAALTASIVCQFQIGYTVIITTLLCSALYVLAFAHKKNAGGIALRLAGAAGIAAAASAVVWLPAFFQFYVSARGGSFFENIKTTKLLAPMETTMCMLLCTSAIGAACLFLCFKKRFAQPGVLYAFACLSLFVFPLALDPINMVWHAGSYQAFPSRYGFIPLYFGLVLVAAALNSANLQPAAKHSNSGGLVALIFGIGAFAGVLCYIQVFHREAAGVYVRSLWGNLTSVGWGILCFAIGAGIIALILFMRAHKLLSRRIFTVALCVVIAMEGLYNGLLYIGLPAHDGYAYTMMMDLAEQLPPDNTARAKYSRKYADANTIGAMGYSSTAHYSSFTRTDYMEAQKRLGYSGYWMEMSGLGGTLLSDNFMGINTVICQRDEIDPLYNAEQVIYQNNWYALVNQPLVPPQLNGFVVAATPAQIETIPGNDRFAVQDWLYQNIYGQSGQICIRYEPAIHKDAAYWYDEATGQYTTYFTGGSEQGYMQYELNITEKETLYFDCFLDISNNLAEPIYNGFGIWVNDVYLEGAYPNSGCNGLLNLGTFENETVVVRVEVLRWQTMNSFGVCGIREQSVAAAAQNVQTAPLEIQNNTIEAYIETPQSGLLVVPIAYDEGLSVAVNGQQVQVYKVLDGFVAVPIQQGFNTIKFSYSPKGFTVGAIGTVLGALGIIVLLFLEHKQKAFLFKTIQGKQFSGWERKLTAVARFLLYFIAVAAFIALYILPIVIWLQGERTLAY